MRALEDWSMKNDKLIVWDETMFFLRCGKLHSLQHAGLEPRALLIGGKVLGVSHLLVDTSLPEVLTFANCSGSMIPVSEHARCERLLGCVVEAKLLQNVSKAEALRKQFGLAGVGAYWFGTTMPPEHKKRFKGCKWGSRCLPLLDEDFGKLIEESRTASSGQRDEGDAKVQ